MVRMFVAYTHNPRRDRRGWLRKKQNLQNKSVRKLVTFVDARIRNLPGYFCNPAERRLEKKVRNAKQICTGFGNDLEQGILKPAVCLAKLAQDRFQKVVFAKQMPGPTLPLCGLTKPSSIHTLPHEDCHNVALVPKRLVFQA